MTTVFITGINGFIGSHLASHLLRRGDDVIGLVRTTSDTRNLTPLFAQYGTRIRLVVGDLRDPTAIRAVLPDVDYVFHLGAVLQGTSEREFRETNVDGTANLVRAVVRRQSGRLKRFLLVSSQAAAGPNPTEQPLTESATAQPMSWYGTSKRDAEQVVLAESAHLPATIVRPVGVYGERDRDLSGGTFPFVRAGLLPKIGLRQKRISLVYVRDLVEGIIAAAESPASVGKTYFLAHAQPNTTTSIVRAIAKAMGKRIRLPVLVPHVLLWFVALFAEWAHLFTRARPMLTRDKWRELRQRYWVASPEAAKKDLRWTAGTSLEHGMQAAVGEWLTRVAADRDVRAEPGRDRAAKTYSLAVAFGLVIESSAALGDWYAFDPEWLVAVAVVGFFGGVIGTIAFLTVSARAIVTFLLGASAFVAVEVLNQQWLHVWEFAAYPFGLWNPWVRALALAVPTGLVGVMVNALIRMLFRTRQRIG